MTPGARVAAAIECLDAILAGQPAEQCLTTWARSHRFAGSKDRAAIRDLVFSALRRKRSLAWVGGAPTGRGLMIGHVRLSQDPVGVIFSGTGYSPTVLSEVEQSTGASLKDAPWAVQHDVPDWLETPLRDALGDRTDSLAQGWRDRAPVHLRVYQARCSREEAVERLKQDGVKAQLHPQVSTALVAQAGGNQIKQSRAYRDGWVDLQDAAGQAAVLALGHDPAPACVLDYCAGGGGKALAMADLWPQSSLVAHDADRARMRDLPQRARRAGVAIRLASDRDLEPGADYDLVLCDVPCSGSGTWRRQPDAKWKLTPDRLRELTEIQARILRRASHLVGATGRLCYMTCSVLQAENEHLVSSFLDENPDWSLRSDQRFDEIAGGDMFYLATLTR